MIPEIVLYLIKVNIALLLFYAAYHLILQRYTFHKLNRFYLLFSLIYSSMYPLIDLSAFLTRNTALKTQLSGLTPDWQQSITYVIIQTETSGSTFWGMVLFIFWTGVLLMTIRLITQLVSLWQLHSQSNKINTGKYTFRRISRPVNPFSFWSSIYINPDCHEPRELQSILEHERVHVKQLHTLDVLFAELSTVFYWFNPGVWLMKKAIKTNLEFLTDQEVLQSGVDSRNYQYALLRTSILPENPLPVNNFHFITLKKRIAMMNKKPSSRLNLSGYLLILPAIMGMVLFFTASRAALNNETLIEAVSRLPEMAQLPINPEVTQAKATEQTVVSAYSNALQPAKADTNKTEVRRASAVNIISVADTSLKDNKPLYYIDGARAYQGTIKLKPENISRIEVLKGEKAARAYGAEANRGVIAITTKGQENNPDVIEFKKKIEAVGQNEPVKGAVTIAGKDALQPSQKISIRDLKDVFILLDGKEVSKEVLDELPVTSIAEMEVFKGESAVKRYGEKGRKGVIVITTRK